MYKIDPKKINEVKQELLVTPVTKRGRYKQAIILEALKGEEFGTMGIMSPFCAEPGGIDFEAYNLVISELKDKKKLLIETRDFGCCGGC